MRVYGMVRSVALGSMFLLSLMCVEAHGQRKNSGGAELSDVIKAGQTKMNPKDGLTYVWVPPGTFMMGCSPYDDYQCSGNEKPPHSVTITKGFWMGQTPVTQAAFQRVKGFNPSRFRGDQLPAEQVTWFSASDYCSAVGLRLPTEAEWEYAARAGATARRYGDMDSIAWYAGNSGNQTHDVAQKQPNAWKLYDMLGNVLEFTADWYDQNYYSQSPSQDPHGPISGKDRVVRGTAWYINGGDSVSARNPAQPGERNGPYGFRCAGEGDLPISSSVPKPVTTVAFSPGQMKVNSRDGLTYVWIPAGTFMMGCSPRDVECSNVGEGSNAVTITKGFWLGQTPVTQAAYQRVKGTNPSYVKGDQRPVETVNWDEAASYCSVVGMRLPWEAEWEYAARAGSTASRYGDIDSIAWYRDNSGNQTHDVAQQQPNVWKLYDMLGNVWQWTSDWYDQNHYDKEQPSLDPHGPSSGQYRVLRGGSYGDVAGFIRVSYRGSAGPNSRSDKLGFRCAGEVLP